MVRPVTLAQPATDEEGSDANGFDRLPRVRAPSIRACKIIVMPGPIIDLVGENWCAE